MARSWLLFCSAPCCCPLRPAPKPVPIYAYSATRVQRLGWVTVRGPETPFDIELPMKIDKITIDEWADILCTVDYQR